MKNNKLSFFIFIIFSAFFSMLFSSNKNLEQSYAQNLSTVSFVIESITTNEQKTITLSLINSDDSLSVISHSISCFDEVFEAIEQRLLNDGIDTTSSQISIEFDDFVYFENSPIKISSGNFIFSGTITNPLDVATFEFETTDQNNIIFDNLIISSDNDNIVIVKKSEIPLNLTLKNSSFESTAETSYALKFEDTESYITFSETNTHTSTYFFNYQPSINISFDNFSKGLGNINITLPSNLNNEPVLNDITSEITQAFKFFAENQIYEIETKTFWESKTVICSSIINLSTNLNGGTASNQVLNNFAYGNLYEIDTTLTKAGNNFAGWFGCLTIDEQTYYFDSNLLALAASENFEEDILKNIFSLNLQNLSNNYKITKFFDNTDAENINFTKNFINLYETINQIPQIIAKWEYEITFNTHSSDEIKPITSSIDAPISVPTATKEGHSFVGWFLDETCLIACDFENINTNTTVFAKWNINSYELTFYDELNSQTFQTQTLNYGEIINFPSFEKTGHYLDCWTYENGDVFNQTIMPAENTILIAHFEKNTYMTYFETDGNEYIAPVWSKFEESIAMPSTPTKSGYTFKEWIDKDTNLPFDFSTTPAKSSRTAVATWTANTYTATFMFVDINNKQIKFGEPILSTPIKKGYKFLGWYDVAGHLVETMPASDITLYPSWQEKQSLTIELTNQSDFVDSQSLGYKINSDISRITIEYFVDQTWTTNVPSEVGTYDVRITRTEDDNYAEFSQVLSGGFKLLPKHIDLKLAIIVLYALFFVEICLIILVKWVAKQKQNSPSLAAIIFPFAMFETNEFIATIIAMVCVISAFVWLIVELVRLHKTNLSETPSPQVDNRSTHAKIEDKSNDIEIERRVEELLSKNNLTEKSSKKQIKINNDEDIDYLTLFDDNNE